jgi:hypothetical protein
VLALPPSCCPAGHLAPTDSAAATLPNDAGDSTVSSATHHPRLAAIGNVASASGRRPSQERSTAMAPGSAQRRPRQELIHMPREEVLQHVEERGVTSRSPPERDR